LSVHLDAAPSPITSGHHLVRIGLQAQRRTRAERSPVHLVYLVDTSGSMNSEDKLGLARKSLRLLTEQLKAGDTVALCTYAGDSREVLPPTGIEGRDRIMRAIDDLRASGSTAMESGIDIAYRLAARTHVPGHVSHVVILSDGDANVGRTSHDDLLKTIASYKDTGITLSTVGFGMGNYKDETMEQLADKGDGNYSYIDSEKQAAKVFGKSVDGMLETVARDVKVQVEFDPRVVQQYRLIGYENRHVENRDFRNDRVDGGEVGAGHAVTALYDVVLAGVESPLSVHVRYRPEGGKAFTEMTESLQPSRIAKDWESAPRSLQFATAVASFAEVLRDNGSSGATLDRALDLARKASRKTEDDGELVRLIERAKDLSAKSSVLVAKGG
jgi:Ca-activated chloride channel family protein